MRGSRLSSPPADRKPAPQKPLSAADIAGPCTVSGVNKDVSSLKEGDLESREESLRLLLEQAERDDASAIAALRTVVRDYRDFHRSIYCRALNQIEVFGDADLEAPLLTALADTRYNCQAWAATGCTALGIRAAVPALLDLVDHSQWIVRERAIVGLGVLGDETVVGVLAPLLGDPAEWVRHRAADALAAIGGDAALAALWAEFAHRRYERIGYIASALAQFAPGIIPRLIDAAESTDPDQRYWAATALGSTGDERAVATLSHLVAEDRGSTVFDGRVSVSAKKGLRTLRRIQAAVAARAEPTGQART
jgi:HEAT repeat protein